ncbi:MAG: NusG domain II-containing protein [Peptostreptococcaceae bacterium]|nr:NusG domain II-containing protein [Peptostreptococcaceae bacterium]
MKKMDLIIIVCLLALALIPIFALGVYRNRPVDVRVVEIKMDGELYESFEWIEGLENEINIDTEFGINRIVVDNEGLRIAYSDCANQVCVLDGVINSPGEILVCLPHRLIIEIKGKRDGDGVDDFSY